ncbi:MAG TPA: hypothetical protein VFM93_05060 [Candidatus Limnocylindria bacterium]|nr:hypothetical protein [Candidatus Limnocylindria bacterium]
MDALSDRGQAHAFAVLSAAVAAAAIAGLVAAEDRLLAGTRERRSTEAAVQAAGAAVADAHFAFVRSLRREPTAEELAAFLADAQLLEGALAAARAVAAANGGPRPVGVTVRDAGRSLEIDVRAGRLVERVAVEKVACCAP